MKRLLLLLAAAAATAEAGTCTDCHPGVEEPVLASAHPQTSCTDCHNGDDTAAEMTDAHATEKKFIGRPKALEWAAMCGDCHREAAQAWTASPHLDALRKGDPAGATCVSCHAAAATPSGHSLADCGDAGAPSGRLQVAATCAKCHADGAAMARSGVRADAVELYGKGPHGHNVLEEKAADGPSCVDCHDAHASPRSSDPASATHPSRQAQTCGRCHGDEKVMKPHGLSHGLVAKYEGSPHARGLDSGAPSCAGCHGPHLVRVPPVTEIVAHCGRCHEGPAREFAAGPHGKAVRTDPQTGEATPMSCEDCHGAHGARRPESPWAARSCGKCHAPGTPALADGERLSSISADTRADLVRLHGLLERARARGHQAGEGCEALAALDGAWKDMSALAHGVSAEAGVMARTAFERDAKAVEESLGRLVPGPRDLRWLPAMWAFVLAGVVLMWRKSRA